MIYNLDKRLENEIISYAKRFGVKKMILFGSRARGDNRERSDIDLAASGGNIYDFHQEIEENLPTLLKCDVINLDKNLSEDFLAEIKRDGIILFEEVPAMKKFDAFNKCLDVLLNAERIDSEIYRMGIIGQFNLTFELSWKALGEILIYHGVSAAKSGSPREIIKSGYEFHFINDEETWLDMLKRRNESIHVYDEEIARELVNLIFEKYLSAFTALRDEINQRKPKEDNKND